MLRFRTYNRTLHCLRRPSNSSGGAGEQLGIKGRRSGFGGYHIRLGLEPCPVASRVLHHLQLPFVVCVAKLALHVPKGVTCFQLKRPIGSLEAVGVGAVPVKFIDVS